MPISLPTHPVESMTPPTFAHGSVRAPDRPRFGLEPRPVLRVDLPQRAMSSPTEGASSRAIRPVRGIMGSPRTIR